MSVVVSCRRARFTAGQAKLITGLSHDRQRRWLVEGYLKPRENGRYRYTPLDLAEMRLIMKLRELGVSLPQSAALADEAAPSAIYIALTEYAAQTVGIDRATGSVPYLTALREELETGAFRVPDLPEVGARYRFAVLQGGRWSLLVDLGDIQDNVEVAAFVHLKAIAQAIAYTVPSPLFTFTMPNFRITARAS